MSEVGRLSGGCSCGHPGQLGITHASDTPCTFTETGEPVNAYIVRACPVCGGQLPAGYVRHMPVCRDIHLLRHHAAIEERRKLWWVDPDDHYVPPLRKAVRRRR